eukprot:Sro1305_g261200.1 n/a (348) ;mRNA; r:25419-26462
MGEQTGDGFGTKAVAMTASGNRLAVGAPGYNVSSTDKDGNAAMLPSAGFIQVYDWIDNSWTAEGPKILGRFAGDQLGTGVDLSSDGKILAAGGESPGGQVNVYRETTNNSGDISWEQVGSPILSRTTDDLFGQELALSADGTRLAVGASKAEVKQGLGYARVYEFDGADWQQMGQDLEGDSHNCRFGRRIAMSSDGLILAAAARNADDNSGQNDVGNVHIYRYDSPSNAWEQMGQTLWGSGEADKFGISVDISDDGSRVVVGANQKKDDLRYGYVRIFDFDDETKEWTQVAKDLKGQDMSGASEFDRLGNEVALNGNGNLLAVGSDGGNRNGFDSGHVQVFDLAGLD